MSKLIKIRASDLKPGRVYITYGTAQQIHWLFQNEELNITTLWQPTTKQIRQEIGDNHKVAELFSDPPRVVIIHPAKLEGTKFIKPLSKKGSGGNKTVPNDARLPSEQYFKVHPSVYCFVICCDANGDLDPKKKRQAASLIGGCYEELNLQHLDYEDDTLNGDMLPLSALKGLHAPTIIGDPYKDIINDLLTLEGVSRWGGFNRKEFFKLFLLPEHKYPPLLSKAKALCLLPYIEPFIKKIESSHHFCNNLYLLHSFAYWVYCSTFYWSHGTNQGLGVYTKRGAECYKFWPSTKAKLEWTKLTKEIGM